MSSESSDVRTPEQQEIIFDVLQRLTPLDVDIAGVTTTKRIAAGRTFRQVDGGRHMDLAGTIGLLSGIASLTQILLQLGIWVGRKTAEKQSMRKTNRIICEQKAISIEKSRARANEVEHLRLLLIKNPDVLSNIYDALNEICDLAAPQDDGEDA